MKVVNQEELKKITAEGVKGKVDVMDAVSEESLVTGVRIVHPHSIVPGEGHMHKERQLNYLISGKCEVYTTDEKERTQLRPGDFIILDSNEPHFYVTFEEPAVIFEVRFE
jgi:quercetin dioxygenase-like cupin family protein